ncbi:MAG: ABC transporter substrate-binding protein [Clostridia bacterium]|nr:ABC transporter substrate-binding protein [Clostridia bacterium]
MKKLLCLLLLATVLLLLAGCNMPPALGIDSSGLEPFVIGGVGPLTEDRGQYGRSVSQGAQLAVEEINATGGVNGFRLVLNFQDSKGNPETAGTLYDKLTANSMRVLLGGVFSDETEVLAKKAAKDGLLTLTPTASHSSVLTEDGTVFRVCYSDVRIGEIAANFVADHRLADRVAVLWSDDYFGGSEQAEAFATTFDGRGGRVTVYEMSAGSAETAESEPDFSQILTALAKNPPSMLYFAASPELVSDFLRDYPSDQEAPVKIFMGSCGEALVSKTNVPLLESALVVTPYSSADPSPLMQNFLSAYREAYNETPDRYAADAYDGVYAIAEAMKKAGITPENVDDDDFSKKMISAMTKITVNGVSDAMSWTADGETTRPASVKVIQEGKLVPFVKENGT